MKKNLYLPAVVFFLSFITASTTQAQWLSDKEKNALLAHWASDPKLSAFNAEAKQTVLNNSANVQSHKPCAVAAQQRNVLEDAIKFLHEGGEADMAYDKLNTNFPPEYIKKIFPRFNKKEYMNSQTQYQKVVNANVNSSWAQFDGEGSDSS